MSDEQSPTFGLQAAGATPSNETRQVEQFETPDPVNHPVEGVAEVDTTEKKLLAGKYETQEQLEKGYLELQRKQSTSTGDMDMAQFLEHVGVDAAEIGQNWKADGQLSDEQYSKFKAAGWSKSIVDSILRANQAAADITQFQQRDLQHRAHQLAGGEEEFQGLINWAQNSYPDDQKAALNQKLGDPAQFEGAIKEMLYDYKMQTGSDVRHHMVQGESMPNVSSGFTSSDEVVSALAAARKQGRIDQALQKRLANTPAHILQGIDS